MVDFDFEAFKRVVEEYEQLVDFVDTRLEKITNGATRGVWDFSIEIEADDTIRINYVDQWDDRKRVRLPWDELVDDTGEKFRERQAEERRKQEENHKKRIRDAELRQLELARDTIARLEAKHASE